MCEEEDEDELLAALSSEELWELERELAALDDTVPIGLRQRDQTARGPTGAFDRAALLRHWEDENRKLLQDERTASNGGQNFIAELSCCPDREKHRGGRGALESDRKKTSPKGTKANEDQAEKKDEKEKETPMSQRSESRATETTDQDLKESPDGATGNPTAVLETLERILRDDPAVSEVNLNNIEDVSQDTLLGFAEALRANTHVCLFSLSNTHADDRVALAVSRMLRENRSVRNLNIDSNFVSGRGVLALLEALQHNKTLVELRFHNQRHMCGGKVEMEMVQLLRQNTTLLKLGYQFDLPGPRMAATGILTRNQDQQRQRRLRQKTEQSPPEASGHGLGSPAVNGPPKKTVGNQNRNPPLPPPPPALDPPTRKISNVVKQHEGSNMTKTQSNQRKTKSKKLKNGANEKECAEILNDLKKALKPSLQERPDEPPCQALPGSAQRSSHDNLMAAIRGSSIGSLKRVDLSHA